MRSKEIDKCSNPSRASLATWFISWESLVISAPVRLVITVTYNQHQGRLNSCLLWARDYGHKEMKVKFLLFKGCLLRRWMSRGK